MGVAAPKIYLDSCVVIHLVEEHATYAVQIRNAIAAVPEAQFCISPLVELECLVGPLKLADTNLQTQYEQFFTNLSRLNIPDEVYQAAAKLRAIYNLRTPDAIHIAVAQQHGCTQFWTNDNRLATAASTFVVNITVSAP